MEEVEEKVTRLEIPAEFDCIASIIELANHYDASSASVSMRKRADVSYMFIAADCPMRHPRKLLRADPDGTNLKSGFIRGWRGLADRTLLLVKNTIDDQVSYAVAYCVAPDDSSQDVDIPVRKPAMIHLDSDYNIVSGEDNMEMIQADFSFRKRKKLYRYFRSMGNRNEILLILPLKCTGELPMLKSGLDGDDIVSTSKKKSNLTYSLKTYLSVVFLLPGISLVVEGSFVTATLWVRSLSQTETTFIELPSSSTSSQADANGVALSCGYSSAWPLISLLLAYHNGRLLHCMQPKKRSRSQYKFVGIIHELPECNSSQSKEMLSLAATHYTTELEELRSRPIRISKMDEEWQQCTRCLRWRQVTQPLMDGVDKVCQEFDMLISCKDAEMDLYPKKGSNKVPPTPATTRKRRRSGKQTMSRPSEPHVRVESPIDLDCSPKMEKSPVAGVSAADEQSADETSPPRKSTMLNRPRSKSKTTSPKKPEAKSLTKLAKRSPTKALVFTDDESVADRTLKDVVDDSLSENDESKGPQSLTPFLDSPKGKTVPKLSSTRNRLNISKNSLPNVSATESDNSKVASADEQSQKDYYSLSDDEDDDPKSLKIKQLKSELSRTTKRLEMLRKPVVRFLNDLSGRRVNGQDSGDFGHGHGQLVQPEASPEELISVLMGFVEDSDTLKSMLVWKH